MSTIAPMERQGTAKVLVTPRVVVFASRDGRTLFLEGGPRKWFAGKLNGLGGSVERGESPLAAARRELTEECGLAPETLRLGAIRNLDTDPPVLLFVFEATLPPGDLVPCDEGRLVWLTDAEISDPATPLLPDVRGLLDAVRRGGGVSFA